MVARIYRPCKNAMQSGLAATKIWRLDYEPESAKSTESLMGYTSSSDMNSQIKLTFSSLEEAVDYCTRHGIAYEIKTDQLRAHRPRTYAENFRYGRIGTWTH